MRNIALEIAYDGTRYSGWQIQRNALTIQGVIEDCLIQILKNRVRLKVAGRTDGGVHALGQIASFDTINRMKEEQFKLAINSMLPGDIRINRVFEAPLDFHPRYSAQKRWYRYIINNAKNPSPFFKNYSLWVRRELNMILLNSYCQRIIGVHDFSSFSSRDGGEVPIRRIYECMMSKKEDFVFLDIIANSFLRKMVRTIVGTFLKMERGGEDSKRVDEIIEAKNRKEAGQTAYPCGLYLVRVFY